MFQNQPQPIRLAALALLLPIAGTLATASADTQIGRTDPRATAAA